MKLNLGLNNCWPTPVYMDKIDEQTCRNLIASLLTVEKIDAPAGDWSSNIINSIPLLKTTATNLYTKFFKEVYNYDISASNISLNAWLTGTKTGYSMVPHNHKGSPFTMVIYPLAEEKASGGELVLQDPRFNCNRGYKDPFLDQFEDIVCSPNSGDCIIIPGYVYHYVTPYMSKLRLAVPVDIFIK